MKNTLNILHYCIYLMHYKLHLFFNKINPAILLYKIPFIEKKTSEKGIDLIEVGNDLYGNKEYGSSVDVAGGVLIVIVFALKVILTKILIQILNIDATLNNYFLILFGITSVTVCYYIVFRKAR